MRKKSPGKASAKARDRKARKPKHAKLKAAPRRAAAGAGAAAGALPHWTTAQVEEAFRRFKNAHPEPKGELRHIDP
ncbi:MAG: endonuclease III, partial [Pseudolabrys sp.]